MLVDDFHHVYSSMSLMFAAPHLAIAAATAARRETESGCLVRLTQATTFAGFSDVSAAVTVASLL